MASQQIKHIAVIGGGTSGALAALYLQKAFPKNLKVSLVAPKDNDGIGVGESTTPSLRFTMNFLGLKETEWMSACQSTFKLGVMYKNWTQEDFFHPFHFVKDELMSVAGGAIFPGERHAVNIMDLLTDEHLKQKSPADWITPNRLVSEQRKSPVRPDNKTRTLNYSYHIDALKLCRYLKKICEERKVHCIDDKVTDVKLDADGSIGALSLEKIGEFKADLYIDATGFRSLIMEQSLKVKFIEDTYLPCNHAIASSMEYPKDIAEYDCHTQVTAMKHGWSWKIPLQERFGIGYVFSDKHCSKEEAFAELGELYPGLKGKSPLFEIPLRPGRLEKFWTKNCISIGLSTSFLDPLESTGIYFTEFQLSQMIQLIQSSTGFERAQDVYNRLCIEKFEQLRLFILFSYWSSTKNDTAFWQSLNVKENFPDTLHQFCDSLKESFVQVREYFGESFHPFNVACFLAATNQWPQNKPLLALNIGDENLNERLKVIAERTQKLLEVLPSQKSYLTS